VLAAAVWPGAVWPAVCGAGCGSGALPTMRRPQPVVSNETLAASAANRW